MKRIGSFKWCIAVWLVQLVAAVWMGSMLPDDARVPSHWNLRGDIDGYMGVTMGVWMPLGVNLLLLAVFGALPWISPRYREQSERFERVMPDFCLMLMLGFTAIQVMSLRLAMSPTAAITGRWIPVIIGSMLAGIGNLMPKLPHNYMVGVRVPWTLNSPEVWRVTHRVGGWCFAIAGILIALTALFPPGKVRMAVSIVAFVILLWPVVHAYIAFLRADKREARKDR